MLDHIAGERTRSDEARQAFWDAARRALDSALSRLAGAGRDRRLLQQPDESGLPGPGSDCQANWLPQAGPVPARVCERAHLDMCSLHLRVRGAVVRLDRVRREPRTQNQLAARLLSGLRFVPRGSACQRTSGSA